jgi:hypothetical protein
VQAVSSITHSGWANGTGYTQTRESSLVSLASLRGGKSSRSAVGCSGLPLGIPVEAEAVVQLRV